jgi:hypothetical protein
MNKEERGIGVLKEGSRDLYLERVRREGAEKRDREDMEELFEIMGIKESVPSLKSFGKE